MRAGALSLFFLVVVVYSLIRSKAKVWTAVWMVVAMGATFLLGWVAATIEPEQAALFGVGAMDLSLLTGALAALIHSRRAGRRAA